MAKDWDYLIILDACRYDIFEEVASMEGNLNSVISRGSHSKEFATKNFANRELYNTVYVTANGYGARIADGAFHDLIFTDEDDAVEDVEVLHSSAKGMAPSTVYNATIDAYEKYPNKRIISHFMQPHSPYLGERAEELRKRVKNEGLIVLSRDPEKIKNYDQNGENVVSTLGGAVREGYMTMEEFKEVYVENLEIVLEYVSSLIEYFDGKIVVTADHGQSLGEKDVFGHPQNTYMEELRRVPWLTVDSGDRPEVTSEKPTTLQDITNEAIEKRLVNLGYKT